MTIPLGWMSLRNKKGAGATAGTAGRTGGDFFLPTGACATALSAVTIVSLRSGHTHVRLLLAFVGGLRLLLAFAGGLGEPRALGGSDGEGLLCPRCERRCHGCHGTCRRSAVPTTQRLCHRSPKPPILLVITADVAVRHGVCSQLLVRSCVTRYAGYLCSM